MIVVMARDTASEDLENVRKRIEGRGLRAQINLGEERAVVGVMGSIPPDFKEEMELMSGVSEVVMVSKPYKLASKEFHPDNTVVRVGDAVIGGPKPVIMAGPCSVEDEEQMEKVRKVRGSLGKLKHVIRMTGSSNDAISAVELAERGSTHSNAEWENRWSAVTTDDICTFIYTSGTTGFPKGAVLTHRGLVNNARFYAARAGAHQATVWANFMPLFHTSGCGMVSLGCLQVGCKMLLVQLFDPQVICRLIEQQKVSTVLAVPTMLVALLEVLEQQAHDVSSMEMVSCGGAMVAPELVRQIKRVFGCKFGTLYGQTETSPVITQHHPNDRIEDICATIGQPLPQTSVSIRNIEDNRVVAIGTVGEICVDAYCNMAGYHGDDAATSATIDESGWLHTGDLGLMDSRGYLRITGRVKEMIIRGGENLFPVEIENLLLEHPLITEVAVVGLPDQRWGEIVACFMRSDAVDSIDPEELHNHCRAHLSPQKSPEVWCMVDAFPLTGSGKIQKFALREGYLRGLYKAL